MYGVVGRFVKYLIKCLYQAGCQPSDVYIIFIRGLCWNVWVNMPHYHPEGAALWTLAKKANAQASFICEPIVIEIGIFSNIKINNVLVSIQVQVVWLTSIPCNISEGIGKSIEIVGVIPSPVCHLCTAWNFSPPSCPHVSVIIPCKVKSNMKIAGIFY